MAHIARLVYGATCRGGRVAAYSTAAVPEVEDVVIVGGGLVGSTLAAAVGKFRYRGSADGVHPHTTQCVGCHVHFRHLPATGVNSGWLLVRLSPALSCHLVRAL
jgi:hypothetical protein